MWEDFVRLALKNISRKKTRSWLTMLGIFVGVGAVVALISLGQGFQNAINEEFEKVGPNRIIISAGGAEIGPMGGSLSSEILTEREVELIKNVRGIRFAVGILTALSRIDFNDEVKYVQVSGSPTDSETVSEMEDIGLFEIGEGRQFRQNDRYKAILGYNVAHNTFEKELRVGDKIRINGKEFEVVGVQEKIGTGIHDVIIRVPLKVARDLFNKPEEVSFIVAAVQKDFNVEKVSEEVKRTLRRYRKVKKGQEDFRVQTSKQIIGRINLIVDVVKVVVIGIAAISLFVGGVGIMNTMYTSILERTKEIGVMKAVGARNSSILLLFLLESGFLGLIGGIIGIILGLFISKAGELIASSMGSVILKAYIGPDLIFGALLFSFLIGALSGALPALQAARLNPVDSLRGKIK